MVLMSRPKRRASSFFATPSSKCSFRIWLHSSTVAMAMRRPPRLGGFFSGDGSGAFGMERGVLFQAYTLQHDPLWEASLETIIGGFEVFDGSDLITMSTVMIGRRVGESSRFFFGWRPLLVSPLSPMAFFTPAGARILASEILWVWLPLAGLVAAVWLGRRRVGA